jgi:hypothetical protein
MGWPLAGQAHLARDFDEDEDEQDVVLFCPQCARREFGPFDAEP